jgi:hypothetical protein
VTRWVDVLARQRGVSAPPLVTVFGTPGTWSDWTGGFQADVCRLLDPERFYWQGVGYPASFGPVNGPATAPSYVQSRAAGVAENLRLINLLPAGSPFILGGYSQGADVVRRVQAALIGTAREADCKLVFTFGDPARQPGDTNLDNGAGAGISRFAMPANQIPVVTCAAQGDMYCTTPWPPSAQGDDMQAVYDFLTSLQIPLTADLFTSLLNNQGLLAQVIKLISNPIGGLPGLVGALGALVQFAATGAHGSYGPFVQPVADLIGALVPQT